MCENRVLIPIPEFLKTYDPDLNKIRNNGEFGANDYGEACFKIDECIVELLKWIWSKGIITTGCCCGHGNYPRIGFVYNDHEYVIDQFDHPKFPKMGR
jgi:hypothetical protein